MNEILKILIPAIIALTGIVVGYYQWKRSQEQKRHDAFVAENRTTYIELWHKLEDVHVKLRTNTVSLDDFRIAVRDVNSFILRNSLYLDDLDRTLSNEYLNRVYDFALVVKESGDSRANEAMAQTLPIQPEVTRSAKEITRAQNTVDEARNVMIQRFRKIIRAG